MSQGIALGLLDPGSYGPIATDSEAQSLGIVDHDTAPACASMRGLLIDRVARVTPTPSTPPSKS